MTKIQLHFSVWDYVVFIGCLFLSLAIGLKYALTGGKQKTTDEFLMASRKMKYAPVALSLMVTFISSVTVLGVPAEIFLHGTDYCFLVISYFLCFPIVAHVFIPVFYRLKITSVYEYLELRFSKSIRTLCTVIYMLMLIIYMGVVLYTPALALSTVTNVNVWASVVTLCIVCTVYTAIGGLKAVIWTDVFQAIVMIGGQIVVLAIGANKVGGIGNAWQISRDVGRISMITFDPSPFERHTFWTLGIGGAFMCLSLYGTSQTAVQRYLSCGTMRDAQITAYLNVPLLIIVMIISGLLGIVSYAEYHCENPLATGAVSKSDQLLIYYMMDVLDGYPGLPGMFVACLFSAALSTISSCFNALATLTMQDLIKPYIKLTDRQAVFYSKISVMGYGILCLVMSAVASSLGSVLIAAISLFGIIGGPLLGLFFLGFFFRTANAKGAMIGFICGLTFSFLIGFGSIAYFVIKVPQPVYKLQESECSNNLNISSDQTTTVSSQPSYIFNATSFENATLSQSGHTGDLYQGASFLFKLSYLWYGGLSVFIVLSVGLLVSWCTGQCADEELNENTLHPVVRRINGIISTKCCNSKFLGKKQQYTVAVELTKKKSYKNNSLLLHSTNNPI